MMRAAVFFRVCHRCENSVRSLRFPCDLRPRHHGARGPTEVLFGAEVRFTVLRTLALLSTNKKVLWLVVVPCFAAESILGFVLSVLRESIPFQLECREPFPVASFAIGSGMTVGYSRAYQRGQNRVFTLLTCVLLRSPHSASHPLLYLHL